MAAAIIVAAVSLSSCATVNYVAAEKEYSAAWVGQTHSAIISSYGAPEREVTDGNGGLILVYEKKTTIVDNSFGHPYGYGWGWGWGYGTNTVQASTTTDYVHFYVNPQGICYQVKTNMCLPGGVYDNQQRAVASEVKTAAIIVAVAALLFPFRPFLFL